MIDCTSYSDKAFLQLLKGNPKYQHSISESKEWEEVVSVIDSLNLKYTEKQLEYVKQKQWN